MSQEAYSTTIEKLDDLENYIGKEIGVSNWITVDQDMIDVFGETTRDEQWIHMDPERAKKDSPYGDTIAHGFLVLSLMPAMSYEVMQIKEAKMGVNYGLNKLRFTSATKVGSKIRGRATLKKVERKGNRAKYITDWVVEIQGEEKPALVAEWIGVAYS